MTTPAKLYAIRCNGETLPLTCEGNLFRFEEGGEQCESCGADVAETLTLAYKVMAARVLRCTCGAEYTARPFTYGSRASLQHDVWAGKYD